MNYWWFFLLFLTVPILVHLFDFRKVKKYYFSSIRFIASLATKSKSKSRLKYYVILSNRLLLFLTIFSFLYLLWNEFESSSGDVAIYHDNSLSSGLVEISKIQNFLSDIVGSNNGVLFDNSEKVLLSKNTENRLSDFQSMLPISVTLVHEKFKNAGSSNNYFLSDFQSLNLDGNLESIVDTFSTFHFIYLEDLNLHSNVSIDTLFINPNSDDLSKLSIVVGFDTYNIKAGKVTIKLMQGTRQLSSIVKDVNELSMIDFDIPIDGFGNYEVVISGDQVEYDNTFHFVVSERAKPTIVIIDDNGFLEQTYLNSTLFNIHRQNLTNLDYELLQRADLVAINSDELPLGLINQFSDLQFLIFPFNHNDENSYVQFLKLELENSEEPKEIDIDDRHPLFSGVFSKRIADGLSPRTHQAFEVRGSFETIIPFRGGQPFLLRKDNIYFFNTFLGSTGGFQTEALFLPLLYQIAFTSAKTLGVPYYYPGDKILLESSANDIPIRIQNSVYEVIPSFNSIGSQLVLEIPKEIEAGKYYLTKQQDTLKHIAINTPKSESVMRGPTFDELKGAFSTYPNVNVTKIDTANRENLLGATSKVSLWKYALILTLLFVLTETLLHRYLK